MKYVLKICYDGTQFAGYQRQPDQVTVQGHLETALLKLFSEPINLAAAGRTDTGVHGLGQVVAFEAKRALPARAVVETLNTRLGDSVAVLEGAVHPDASEFHPRFSALSRCYHYYLITGAGQTEHVLWSNRAWCLGKEPDVEVMARATKVFLGEHDFRTFCSQCDLPHYRRNVHSLEVKPGPTIAGTQLLVVEVRANAFLRRMVRRLVGGLVAAGLGRVTISELQEKLEARNPDTACFTAPPQGLYFHSVGYETDPFSEPPAQDYYRARKRPGVPKSR